jgi:acyl-coenzyme A thioesterase PaaI-like protein
MYDLIRQQLNHSVPFAAHTGIEINSILPDGATAELAQTAVSINHIGTQHAGALFTLGEAASGAAMAGLFASVLLDIRPVAANARIQFTRVATGRITAHAKVSGPAAGLLEAYQKEGRVTFDVVVVLVDDEGKQVAEMQVSWHISRRRDAT